MMSTSVTQAQPSEISITAWDNNRRLTRSEFFGLAELPAESGWFASIDNPHTRRAYQNDIRDFMGFTGIAQPEEFRTVLQLRLVATSSLGARAMK